jgi:hypothetical protein
MKKLFAIVLFCALCFVGCRCNSAAGAPNESDFASVTEPVSYNNGVYYFDCTGKDFAVSLSKFLQKQGPGLEVKAMSSDGTSIFYGRNQGYFVVVGPK